MKKIVAILMCVCLLTVCFVSCKNDEITENTDTQAGADTTTDVTDGNGDVNGDTPGNTDETQGEGIGEAGDNNSDGNWTKPY